MLDYSKARNEFEKYLDGYDRTDDKIKLKIIHTYGVAEQSEKVAHRMGLSEEDVTLARIIALLHDIGRFEQLKQFHSWDASVMDHAAYGVHVLFDEGLIRRFIDKDTWDAMIRTAIAHHSAYSLDITGDDRTLLHARLIRDADKLDNCRVKLEEPVEVLLDASPGEVGAMEVTPEIARAFFSNKCILLSERITKVDYWVSYVAYFYDINFAESLSVIRKENYVSRIIDRIPYTNPQTALTMERMKKYMESYIDSRIYADSSAKLPV